MAARGHIPSAFEGRSVQAPGMMRHGSFPGLGSSAGHRHLEQHPPPELLENKIAVQAAEMERLARENQRLAGTHVALRQDLVVAQQEMQRLQAHMRSIQTESDIQIRMLLEKIKRMEADVRAGESIKKDLQQAHMEAQKLITGRQELTSQIQEATQELHKTHTEVKKLPEMHAELDSLRQEHQRLRATFEYEKNSNMEQVEQMQAMEKNLISMAREVEKLRAEILNTEKRAHAPNPYGVIYGGPDPYAPAVQSGAYANGYGRPQLQLAGGAPGQGMNLYGSGSGALAGGGGAAGQGINLYGSGAPAGDVETTGQAMNLAGGDPVVASGGDGGGWGGSYDAIRGAPSSLPLR